MLAPQGEQNKSPERVYLTPKENEEPFNPIPSIRHRYLLRSCDKKSKGVFMELDADRYSTGVENIFYSEAKISRLEYASFPKFPIRY